MTIYGDVRRKVHGIVTGRPDNFSWLIENKLAGSAIQPQMTKHSG